jgi:hypothetical protein
MTSRWTVSMLVTVVGALCALAPAAHADVAWLCKPGIVDDPCEIPLDTTVREAGKADRVQTPGRPAQAERRFDCFYVYPTVSNQLSTNATKARDPELISIAKYQASRFSTQCRMYAPIYRQITLAALPLAITAGQGISPEATELAYGDVVEAWKDYLAKDNGGRGVVLIGHSQGTLMLRRLIKEQIDPNPALRRKLVGATLMGGNVETAKGRTTGGDFQHVPACTARGEFGCVVAYSTYAEDPPSDSLFGRPGGTVGGAGGDPAQREVACTDPATLSGMTGPVGVTVPSEPFAPGTIEVGIVVTSGGPPPTAPTTWVEAADRYVGSCRFVDGAHVWRYDPVAGSRRPNPFLDRTWGTHLLDMQLGLERLVSIVEQQHAHWDAPQLRLTRRCMAGGRGLRMRLTGSDAGFVQSVTFKTGSRTVARDKAAPFSALLSRRGVRAGRGKALRAVVALRSGRRASVTLSRTLPGCGSA